MSEPYHRFVFDPECRRIVGAFEEMYRAEDEEDFDSWHQDDLTVRQDVLGLIEGRKFTSVLDVGCGKGALLRCINANRIVGIDVSETALRKARVRLPHAEFHRMDAMQASEIDERFDLVVMCDMIFFVEPWRELLQRVAKRCEWLLISAHIPPDTMGTVPSIAVLRDQVDSLFTIEAELGAGNKWSGLARIRAVDIDT